jgi:methionyl-tRNA formyltransferase
MVAADVPALNTRLLFLGSKRLGERMLASMIRRAPGAVCAAVTLDDRADARSTFDAIASVAAASSVPFHVARDRVHAEELIRREAPDLCIVGCWYWLISEDLLRAVPRGFIGVHNSLLPKYRGGSPLVWALINHETEVGASLFSFRAGIDDGPIWLQAKIGVAEDEYVDEVLERLESETLRIFEEGFAAILDGTLRPTEQDHGRATFCAQRIPEDGEIDWTRPAAAVFDFVRAQSPPYPCAFTWYDEQPLKIVRASRMASRHDGTPGQVARIEGDGVVVVCGGATALRVDEVEWGGARLPAARVVRSLKTRFPRLPRGPVRDVSAPVSVTP